MRKETLISKSKNGLAQYVIKIYSEDLKNRVGEPYCKSTTVHKKYQGGK